MPCVDDGHGVETCKQIRTEFQLISTNSKNVAVNRNTLCLTILDILPGVIIKIKFLSLSPAQGKYVLDILMIH